jgi:hypothetical protein
MSLAQPITGGDACSLQGAGGERDALVAHRAVGGEDGGIDAVVPAAGHDLRAVDLERDAMAAVGRQAVKARRDRADATALGGAVQLGQREPGAGVPGRGVLAVDADVRDAQVVVLGRIAGIDGVELRRRVIGSAGALVALVGLIGSGRGDDGAGLRRGGWKGTLA